MHIFSGLAFRSPLHPVVPRNLEGRALSAMRCFVPKEGTVRVVYQNPIFQHKVYDCSS